MHKPKRPEKVKVKSQESSVRSFHTSNSQASRFSRTSQGMRVKPLTKNKGNLFTMVKKKIEKKNRFDYTFHKRKTLFGSKDWKMRHLRKNTEK